MAEALPRDNAPGELPPLALLIHGVGGIWWTLRSPMLALADAGFHAVAVDLRGHGDSDKPPHVATTRGRWPPTSPTSSGRSDTPPP